MSQGDHLNERFISQRQGIGFAIGTLALCGGLLTLHHVTSHHHEGPRLDELQRLQDEVTDLRSSLFNLQARVRRLGESPSQLGAAPAINNRAVGGGARVQIGHDIDMRPAEEWLSTGQYGTMLGVSSEEIRRRIRSGEILEVTYTPGGHARIKNPFYRHNVATSGTMSHKLPPQEN